MDAMDAASGAIHAIVIIRFFFVAEAVPVAMVRTANAVKQDVVREDASAVKVDCYAVRVDCYAARVVVNAVTVHSRLVANVAQMVF